VNSTEIDAALSDIVGEQDPTVKNLKLASLCSEVFRERGIELVVVGGSAIEFYTEGAYTSRGRRLMCGLGEGTTDGAIAPGDYGAAAGEGRTAKLAGGRWIRGRARDV